MTVSIPLLTPLSYDEKEAVRFVLENGGLKIYAVASVCLSLISISNNSRGALVLSRKTSTRQCSLHLIDLHVLPGSVIWWHTLSTLAELTEVKEADEERTYQLRDAELRINLVFADDVEASKLSTKFIRSIRRSRRNGSGHEPDTGDMVTEMGRLSLDDETVRGVETERARDTRLVEGPSSELSQSCSACQACSDPTPTMEDQSSLTNNNSDGIRYVTAQRLLSHSDICPTGTDTWIFTIHGKTYQVPNLTATLVSVKEIEFSETKYKGGFGDVRRAQLSNGVDVAIKTLFTCSAAYQKGKICRDMKGRKRFRNEAAMQSMLSHPNILPLLGIAEAEAFNLGASLVLPWMKNADSRRYVQGNPGVRRLPLILGTIRGIAFLHSKGLVHGDIKARNILISDECVPLLCDFGLTSFADGVHHELSTSTAGAGSLPWMAIELYRSKTPGSAVTQYSDMWAFAMTVIELLTGACPFPPMEAYRRLLNPESLRIPPRPQTEECTNKLWELVQSCWAEEPTSRPAADEAVRIIHAIASSFTE